MSKDNQKNKRLLNTYGISLEDWNNILKAQGGVCAICKDLPGKGILCVDHIHIKGFKSMDSDTKKKYVRGLLCFLCNTSLKGFEKTIDGKKNRTRLEGAYKYFKKYKLKGETCK